MENGNLFNEFVMAKERLRTDTNDLETFLLKIMQDFLLNT